MTYVGGVLLALSLSAFAAGGRGSAHAHARTGGCHEALEPSGTFHLSEAEPRMCLIRQGATAILKIHNVGPAGLVVKNSRNEMSLAAHTELDVVFDGETTLSILTSASNRQTDGTYEVTPNGSRRKAAAIVR